MSAQPDAADTQTDALEIPDGVLDDVQTTLTFGYAPTKGHGDVMHALRPEAEPWEWTARCGTPMRDEKRETVDADLFTALGKGGRLPLCRACADGVDDFVVLGAHFEEHDESAELVVDYPQLLAEIHTED